MRRRVNPFSGLQARLLAWPGALTLLSVLAVLLGAHVQVPEAGPRASAGNVTPALPELRPAPQPGPQTPLLPAPPPDPAWIPEAAQAVPSTLPRWTAPAHAPDLTALGRRQTDGG